MTKHKEGKGSNSKWEFKRIYAVVSAALEVPPRSV